MRGLIQLILIIVSVPVLAQPAAYLTGFNNETCSGDSVTSDLLMTGNGPWTVVINNTQGVYRTLTDIKSPYTLWLKPEINTTYSVGSIKDRDGVEGTGQGTVKLTVLPVMPVHIEMDKTAYFKSDPSIILDSDPDGADFRGNGVIGNRFYPAYVAPEGSPHKISCIYINNSGCPSYDTIDVHVIYGESEVVLVSGGEIINTICDENASYEIQGSNLDGIAGLFALRQVGSPDLLSGYIVDEDSSDNVAVFNPLGLIGTFELIYTYNFDILEVPATLQINVNDLENLTIEGFPDIVCNGDNPYLLTPANVSSDPGAVYAFSGPGITGNQADGYYFHPGDDGVPLGNNTIVLEYSSSNGCYAEVSEIVDNNFSPGVSFSYSPSCLSAAGGVVSFNNTTTGKYAVDQWVWNFGDPDSGSENESNEEYPQHNYTLPGVKSVSLTAITNDGCVVVNEVDALLSNQPTADFAWLHDCYIKGQKISFLSRSSSDFSVIESLEWTFMTENGLVLGSQTSLNPADTILFPFTSQSNYQVQLKVWDEAGCFDQVTRDLSLKPTITVGANGYSESFNGASEGWTTGFEESSWVKGTPDFQGHEADPDNYSWYTELPDGTEAIENSWVESPCFDFRHSTKPVISMDIMKSFSPGIDGAVVQYSEENGAGWITLGEVGSGRNWYNDPDIVNLPGGSHIGWSSSAPFQPDSTWKNAEYSLSELTGKPLVKLRISLASGATTEIGNQGFAFDNILFSEDFKRSLLEHFTNSSQEESKLADDLVDDFVMDNRDRVVSLQYHVDYPGTDPMNLNSPLPPNSRVLFYGDPLPPYSILNGRSEPEFQYDYSGPGEEPNEEQLTQVSLEGSSFVLGLDVDWQDQRLVTTITATCKAESFDPNVQLYVAVIETLVTVYTGLNQDTEFRNVVLDMIPSPAGKFLKGEWTSGESVTKTFEWDYPGYIEDIEELGVVAFVTDRDHGGIILQFADSYLTPQVGIVKSKANVGALSIYPNPSRGLVYVNLGDAAINKGKLLITDLSGRAMLEMKVLPGYSIMQLDISSLPGGMYLVSWIESGVLKSREKLVRIR